MMTSIDGEAITRDAIGNPTNYPSVANYIDWTQGNKISSMSGLKDSSWIYVAFLYNENGLRSEKNMYAAGVRAIKYFWLDNVLQSEYCAMDGYEIIYCYDANGSLIGFTYETSTSRTFYRYVMNLQGDVIALLDENYDVVVKYTYDTWDKVSSRRRTLGCTESAWWIQKCLSRWVKTERRKAPVSLYSNISIKEEGFFKNEKD